MPNFTTSISQTLFDYVNGLITAAQAGPDVVALAQTLNPIFGTDGLDRLKGTTGADVIFGGNSQDFFFGGKGNDLIYTGAGTDYVRAGAGEDTLLGEAGDDRLWGDNENDLIYGGIGNDRVYGGAQHDTLFGGDGNDIGIGGSGDDSLFGGNGKDAMRGGVGDDRLWGGEGNDKLWGDQDDDQISGDAGNDKLYGGDGEDIIAGGIGDDQLYGGAGSDLVVTGSGSDTVYGGAGADMIKLNGGANTVFGGTDADTFVYELGDATLRDFQVGIDQLSISGVVVNGDKFGVSSTGALTNLETGEVVGLVAQDGAQTITLDTGTIVIDGVTMQDLGVETISGVILPEGLGLIEGTSGDDTFTLGHGDDAIYGYGGNDTFDNLRGNDYVFGGAGDDEFRGATNGSVETVHVYGGDGDDRFKVDIRANEGDTLEWFGGAGADQFSITVGHGEVTIHDFEVGVDTFGWQGYGYDGNIYRRFVRGADDVPSNQPVTATYHLNENGDLVFLTGDSTTTIIGISNIEDLGFNLYGGYGTENADIIATDGTRSLATLGGSDIIDNSNAIGNVSGEFGQITSNADRIYGGSGDDTIISTNSETLHRSYLYGGAGDDTIIQARDDDNVYGGAGNDTLQGGLRIYGDDGDDTIASNGNGDGGSAHLFGGDGQDVITAASTDARDFVNGGAGDDLIYGGNGGGRIQQFTSAGGPLLVGDVIYGDDGDDVIYGDETTSDGGPLSLSVILVNHDVIYGGAGNDTIESGWGHDQITGGAGADTFIVNRGDYSVINDYTVGEDTLILDGLAFNGTNYLLDTDGTLYIRETGSQIGVVQMLDHTVSVTSGGLTHTETYVDTIEIQINNADTVLLNGFDSIADLDLPAATIYGTNDADILTGDLYDNQIFGFEGNDVLSGLGGADRLMGGEGNDTLRGGDGDDYIAGGSGDDRLYGGSGLDTFVWGSGQGRDFISDFDVTQDVLVLDLNALNADNFQIIGGDLILKDNGQYVGTINESANGVAINLYTGEDSISIVNLEIADLGIDIL